MIHDESHVKAKRIHGLLPLCVALFCVFAAAVTDGEVVSASTGPEGVEWRLVEVAGASTAPLPGNRQPFILLDSKQKKATGFAGCNSFFSTYALDGGSLKFGPLGSTRRACPEPEAELETAILKALEQTRGWKIEVGELLFVDNGNVLARFTTAQAKGSVPDLQSMTFLSTVFPSGRVTLSRGKYRRPAAPGSDSEMSVTLTGRNVFGTVRGKEAGAVIIATSAGGSGTFYELALLLQKEDGWKNTDTVLLGDRVKVHDVAIDNDQFVVAVTAHGPDDPLCCPMFEVQKRFAVENDRLILAEENPGEEPQLVGMTWQWVQTRYNNDTTVIPSNPEMYTIRFMGDGGFEVKADCNLKSGTYTSEGKRLSMNIITSTMAACEEGSLEEEFVRDLSAGAIFFFRDDDLLSTRNMTVGQLSSKKERQQRNEWPYQMKSHQGGAFMLPSSSSSSLLFVFIG